MLYNYNGYSYFIERMENEVDRSYKIRYWYIVNLEPKNESELKNAIKLSKLFVNYKILDIEYSSKIKSMFLSNTPLCF
tara:strand:+ start:159 stop:392 length:234 start_codon:yes stop_codon:yes gene_type:complete